MMKTKAIFFFASIVVISGCGFWGEKGDLTDEKLMQYLSAYKKMREKAPEILEKFNKNGETLQSGQEGFSEFENTVKESGLSGYTEFVTLNAKIGTIFGIIQGTKGISSFENMHEQGEDMFAEARNTIQKQLDDPNVPEETKAELRKTLSEIEQNQKTVNADYEKNMAWGKFVMDKVQKISSLVVSEKDVEIVKNREKEIFEAYTGFAPPVGLDQDFKIEFDE